MVISAMLMMVSCTGSPDDAGGAIISSRNSNKPAALKEKSTSNSKPSITKSAPVTTSTNTTTSDSKKPATHSINTTTPTPSDKLNPINMHVSIDLIDPNIKRFGFNLYGDNKCYTEQQIQEIAGKIKAEQLKELEDLVTNQGSLNIHTGDQESLNKLIFEATGGDKCWHYNGRKFEAYDPDTVKPITPKEISIEKPKNYTCWSGFLYKPLKGETARGMAKRLGTPFTEFVNKNHIKSPKYAVYTHKKYSKRIDCK